MELGCKGRSGKSYASLTFYITIKTNSNQFWAGVCFLCLVWTYFRLPEPKGRTYGEMDVLFERGISARKFKGTIVDQFAGDTLEATESGNEGDHGLSGKQAVEYDEKV